MAKGEEGAGVVAEELPRTIVRRIVKEKLAKLCSSSSGRGAKGEDDEGEGDGINVHKEAVIAFAESARIFIHYLSATANDICKESKRQIINAEDVFKALEEIEFHEFIDPLRISLEEFRRKNAAKKAESKPREKKRKTEETDSAALKKGKRLLEKKMKLKRTRDGELVRERDTCTNLNILLR